MLYAWVPVYWKVFIKEQLLNYHADIIMLGGRNWSSIVYNE